MRYLFVFLLFFFCQSSIFSQINHWETAVYADGIWHYQLGINEPPSSWNTTGFDDSAWSEGQGSIGYGDGDDNTIVPNTGSLYMRQKFAVADKSKIEMAAFHADFDDGFVAYLNGVEIARANLEGTPPPYDSSTPNLREAIMYNGGLPMVHYLNSPEIQQILNEGENVLAIQTHNYQGASSSDMTSLYWLSFGITDASNFYGPTPNWFSNFGFETALPIVKINTWGEDIPDEPSINGEMGIIWNGNGVMNSSFGSPDEYFGNITIERRGQSSLFLFPKNGFTIETKDENGADEDVQFLNFPEEEDWILHGPYSDKTLIRNVLAMQVANNMGQYASRTRLVELMINEEYEGIYVLMEKIKRDENRVDIANLKPEDISGDELTGGYVFKIDKGETDWFSQYGVVNNPGQKLRFQYVSPKRSQIQPEQEAYIQSYVDSFEQAIFSPTFYYGGKRYDEYIDLPSFVDHFIMAELTKNVDAYRISTYMHKDKDSNGGLLKAGPVWDFNIAFGNADYCTGDAEFGWVYNVHCGNSNPFWWTNMFEDEAFVNTLKCRWLELRNNALHIDTLFSFIDEKTTLLNSVTERNFERWPVLGEYVWPNPVVTGSYQGEVDYLKDFIAARISWMDENIFGECLPTKIVEENDSPIINIFPNPAKGQFNVQLINKYNLVDQISLLNALGHPVATVSKSNLDQLFIFETTGIAPGIYYLQINIEENLFIEKIVLLE